MLIHRYVEIFENNRLELTGNQRRRVVDGILSNARQLRRQTMDDYKIQFDQPITSSGVTRDKLPFLSHLNGPFVQDVYLTGA